MRPPILWDSRACICELLALPGEIFPRCDRINKLTAGSGHLIPENALKLGWKPKWDERRFLDSLDDEIEAVQQLDTVKMSLFDSLK